MRKTVLVLLTLPFVLATLTACESGTSERITVDVPNRVARDYSPEAPGLLRTEGSTEIGAVLCGRVLDEPAQISVDHGFGCLDDADKGRRDRRTAWIEPAPLDWDLEALCDLPPPDPVWSGVDLLPEMTGDEAPLSEVLAESPDPTWDQGSGAGIWKRDGSPCGGHLNIDIQL